MQKELRLFPLNVVVFPEEDLNLHVFEARYKQLIQECLQEKSTFGVPVYMDGEIGKYGTEVEIKKIHKIKT